MHEDITKIIDDGVLAPSGENCQPWRFVVHGDTVNIFNVPEADLSLYNFGQKGSYTAHGALLENIYISALEHGYTTDIHIFPKNAKSFGNTENLVSTVNFRKHEGPYSENETSSRMLYPYLEKRHTNRKDHKPLRLSEEEKNSLALAASDTGFAELKIVDDPATLDILGFALAVNEQVLFENKQLHDFFYRHIFWDKKDEDKAGGFYIETLEFLPHQLKGVKLFKNWRALHFLNKIGKVSRKIAKENAEKYARSGAMATVIINTTDSNDTSATNAIRTDTGFIKGGRAMERVWLTATKLGLSVHPCTGVLYFMERIHGGDTTSFSPEHVELITKAYADIVKAFGSERKSIPMLFRIGHSDPASARSLRMKPNIA